MISGPLYMGNKLCKNKRLIVLVILWSQFTVLMFIEQKLMEKVFSHGISNAVAYTSLSVFYRQGADLTPSHLNCPFLHLPA